MKKSIFFLAAAVCALSACTSEDVVEESVQANAIGFNGMVKKASRATDLTATNLNYFQVYGYYTKEGLTANPVNVFDGEAVTLTGNAWGYADTRYWVPEATYYFYAYSCGNKALTTANGTAGLNLDETGVDARALTISDFICDNSHQDDLIVASNEGYKGKDKSTEEGAVANDKVGFTFSHALTKINAKFTSEFAPGYDIVISNVRINNIRNKGTLNLKPELAWSSVERTAANQMVTLAVDDANNIASAPASEAEQEKVVTTGTAFVLPYEYTNAAVELLFTIEVKQGNDVFLSRNMKGTWAPNWKLGYSYTYNITISGTTAELEPIVFETKENMNVDGFESGSAPEIEFSAN